MKNPSNNEIVNFVKSLDEDGLSVLVETYNRCRKHFQRAAYNQFKPGDKVKFQSRRQGVVEGKVVKRLRKNILILADTGMRWRVTPTLLERC
jgi:hypothetical protein